MYCILYVLYLGLIAVHTQAQMAADAAEGGIGWSAAAADGDGAAGATVTEMTERVSQLELQLLECKRV